MASVPEAGSPEGHAQVAAPAPTAGSKAEFAAQVLQAIGAPASPGNIQFMLAWFAREGTTAKYNPMATTLNYGSSTNFNSIGVKNYADQATGVQATARTLLGGYGGIVADLKANNPQGAAINHPAEFKKWSGGGYDRLIVGQVGDTIGGQPISTAGATTAGNPKSALPPNATPAQVEAYIRQNYPADAGFLNIPEVRTLLIKAAQQNYDPSQLQAELEQTTWWKTNAGTTRLYLATLNTDPATAEQMVQQKMAELAPQVAALGLDMDVRVYATNALKYGWTPQQTAADEATRLRMQSSATGLKAGSGPAASADALAAIANSEYFVPMSRQDTEAWAINIQEGRSTEAQFRDYLSTMADSRFPGLKAQGITPGQYMTPIRNTIANTLDLQPGDVNLLDPKYSKVLQAQGKDGTWRPMTIAEAQQWARSLPDFQYTKGAMDTASQFAENLGKTFGAVA